MLSVRGENSSVSRQVHTSSVLMKTGKEKSVVTTGSHGSDLVDPAGFTSIQVHCLPCSSSDATSVLSPPVSVSVSVPVRTVSVPTHFVFR